MYKIDGSYVIFPIKDIHDGKNLKEKNKVLFPFKKKEYLPPNIF